MTIRATASVESALAQVADAEVLQSRLADQLGISRKAAETQVRDPVRALARYLLDLPCAQDFFSERSGALRLALESALVACRMAYLSLPPAASAEERRLLTREFRFAAAIAAMASAAFLPHRHLIVVVPGAGQTWTEFSEPLSDWLRSLAATEYRIEWRVALLPPNQSAAAALAWSIFGPTLASTAVSVRREFLTAVCVDYRAVNDGRQTLMQEIVASAISRVIEHEMQRASLTRAPVERVEMTLEERVVSRSDDIATGAVRLLTAQPPAAPHGGNDGGDGANAIDAASGKAPADKARTDTATQSVPGPVVGSPPSDPVEAPDPLSMLDEGIAEYFRLLIDEVGPGTEANVRLVWSEVGLVIPHSIANARGLPVATLVARLRKAKFDAHTDGSAKVVIDARLGELLKPRRPERPKA